VNSHQLSALIALLLLALSAPVTAAQVEPADSRAAWGNGIELSRAELNPVLVRRFAMTGEGRATLTHLLKTSLLERMARERHMEVGPEDLNARIAEINRQMRAAGEPGDVLSNLEANNISEAEFRRLLGYSIIQERLSREALGIPPGNPVSKAQQDTWIDEEMKGRKVVAPAPPWADGIAGRCGDAVVTAADYQAELVLSLKPEQVRDTCYQMLLVKGIRQRMPDIAEETYAKAIDLEIDRRRIEAESNPAYQDLSFERLLQTQGMTLELLRTDPAVQVTALSQLWILRSNNDDNLRRVYNEERMLFDSTFGEALRTRVLFLRGAEVQSAQSPRSIDEALAQLRNLGEAITTESDFESAASRHSEDSASRTKAGELGWMSRVGKGLEELRSAAFEDLKSRGPLPPGGRLVAPVRIGTGAVLMWLGEHRPAPSWEEMRGRVRNELRKRFLNEVLPRESMVTILDA